MLGPTASGKSEIAAALAKLSGGEIISVDSMQVYRGMDIGTAKPSIGDRADVPHHMIDVVEPASAYSVAEYQEDARAALHAVERRGAPVVIAGGSGLHFRSLVDPLDFPPHDPDVRGELESLDNAEAVAALEAIDSEAGRRVDLANPRRVVRALEIHRLTGDTPGDRARTPDAVAVAEYRAAVPFVAVGLDPGDELADRVERRMDAMLAAGFVDEVAALLPRLGPTAREAVGYKQLIPVVEGTVTASQGRRQAIRATLALAKRQRTFFRRDPRIRWLPWNDDPGARLSAALAALEELRWTS